VALKRDCAAVQIPGGELATLHAGLEVVITQSLGGSFTVHAEGHLYRVSAPDADALGLDANSKAAASVSGPATPEEMEKLVWETLKTCYDPEIPVNIVDLGLVYDVHFEDLSDDQRKVFVKMTLTAPGCGMGRVIAGDAQERLLALPGLADAEVEIVWDPPWHQSMITLAGRKVLGIEA
jgi:probable FeS assembly SUF system protein SufT